MRVVPISRGLSKDAHAVVVERIASLAAIMLGSEPRNISPVASRASRERRKIHLYVASTSSLLEPIVLSSRFKNVSSLSSPNTDLIESEKDAATSSVISQRHKRAI
jgi:hypothetical protein